MIREILFWFVFGIGASITAIAAVGLAFNLVRIIYKEILKIGLHMARYYRMHKRMMYYVLRFKEVNEAIDHLNPEELQEDA